MGLFVGLLGREKVFAVVKPGKKLAPSSTPSSSPPPPFPAWAGASASLKIPGAGVWEDQESAPGLTRLVLPAREVWLAARLLLFSTAFNSFLQPSAERGYEK